MMDTAFRGLGKKSSLKIEVFQKLLCFFFSSERLNKDSLLSQTSTTSSICPPPPPPPAPPIARSPMRQNRREKTVKAAPVVVQNIEEDRESSSCSSPSSGSDDDSSASDIENEDPQPSSMSMANKRTHADATSTESLSPPRESLNNSSRMILRSSARKLSTQPSQTQPVSTPSFRQQRKHRRIDLDLTPLNTTNKQKLPPTQSSTPQIRKK